MLDKFFETKVRLLQTLSSFFDLENDIRHDFGLLGSSAKLSITHIIDIYQKKNDDGLYTRELIKEIRNADETGRMKILEDRCSIMDIEPFVQTA